MIKEELKKYFDTYIDYYIKEFHTYPVMDIEITETPSICVFGNKNKDGYIQWKYIEKSDIIDFTPIEKKFHIHFSDEVKQFYNSYLFLELHGFVDNQYIHMNPVTDETTIDDFYLYDNNSMHLMIIGFYGNIPLSLCVDVETGKLYTWDLSDDTYEYVSNQEYKKPEFLANSLTELITQMTPLKNNGTSH